MKGHSQRRWPLWLLWALLGLACWSCQAGDSANRIPPAAFEALLADIYRINGLVDQSDSLRDLYHRGELDLYAEALASHGYTLAQFDSTLLDYCRHSEKFNDLLRNVLIRLKALEDSMMAMEECPELELTVVDGEQAIAAPENE